MSTTAIILKGEKGEYRAEDRYSRRKRETIY